MKHRTQSCFFKTHFRRGFVLGIFVRLLFCDAISFQKLSAATLHLAPNVDTALRSNLPDTAFGSAGALPVGVAVLGNPTNRALLKFPIELVPTNAVIIRVTLQIASTSSNPNTMQTADFSLHRLLKDWNETDTTWNNRLAGVSWTIPGGQPDEDFVATSSATTPISPATVSGPSIALFTSEQLISDVELWRENSATNFGWLLTAVNDAAASGKQIASREDNINTPILMIEYTVLATPIILSDPKISDAAFQFSFQATAGQAYEVQARGDISTEPWEIIRTIPPVERDTIVIITNAISGSQRFFRVVVSE